MYFWGFKINKYWLLLPALLLVWGVGTADGIETAALYLFFFISLLIVHEFFLKRYVKSQSLRAVIIVLCMAIFGTIGSYFTDTQFAAGIVIVVGLVLIFNFLKYRLPS